MLSVKVASKDWANTYDFLICELDRDGNIISVGKAIEMQKHETFTVLSEGTFQMNERNAQQLMNELWFAGLRPTEAKYPQGELNAMKAHLEDMRTLVFKS